ncbi:hypothetical protein GRJ2_000905400 [Grus japonensis]|uniref:Uncharacterized protein n=1 Tax=Grus japonensis TaxID=30415 RepID=A0ABC9WGP0_GRUJA
MHAESHQRHGSANGQFFKRERLPGCVPVCRAARKSRFNDILNLIIVGYHSGMMSLSLVVFTTTSPQMMKRSERTENEGLISQNKIPA